MLSNGNVGIGKTDPDGLLTIYDSSDGSELAVFLNVSGSSIIQSYNRTVGAYEDIILKTRSTANGYGMIVKSSGKVGIGTTTPAEKFVVAGSGSSNSFIGLYDTQASGKNFYIDNGHSAAGGVGKAGFYYQDKQVMTFVQTSGYVGIGTNTPQSELHV